MSLSAFCTAEDIILELDNEEALVKMARDKGSTSTSLTDPDVQTRLARFIEDGATTIRSLLRGTVDSASAAPNSELAANLRKWNVIFVAEALFNRLDHTGDQNPYSARARRAEREIAATAKGQQSIGSPEEPQRNAWSSSQDSDPEYVNAAEGGGGRSSKLLERW